MCSPRKSNDHFSIFTFYESKQMSLTQDLRWSLGRSIALQLQRQTDLLLCTINCFLQWDHLPNMAVGDLAFYYTLYLWLCQELGYWLLLKCNCHTVSACLIRVWCIISAESLLFLASTINLYQICFFPIFLYTLFLRTRDSTREFCLCLQMP